MTLPGGSHLPAVDAGGEGRRREGPAMSSQSRDDRSEWQESVLERLLELKREGESDAAFARRIGLQPQHLSNYRSGRHGLSLQTAVRIARVTDLSLDWLLRGEGEPFPASAGPAEEDVPAAVREVRKDSRTLLRKLDELCRGGKIGEEQLDRFQRTLNELMEPLGA